MSTFLIGEAAELVGITPTALRYYEDIGLASAPSRGANGYRVYDDADVARLRFIAGVKGLGLPLADVKAIADASDVDDCSTVAHQVVELVAVRLAQTQTRIGELVALAAQLQTVAAHLADAPSAGPCGDACPCVSTDGVPAADGRTLVPLTRADDATTDGEPIACSLGAADVPDRVADWQALLALATGRESLPDGGVSLTFAGDADLATRVARLAAAEQQCCSFFTFTLHLTAGETRLDVEAPADAADVVAALFGGSG
jgi:DNA-binding transcriptional MerR regulator